MISRPFLIAALATGVSVAAFSTRASADVGAGVIIGGTIGALVGGPPGAVAGMALGAAIGESEDQRMTRIYGAPTYADAPRGAVYATPPAAVYLPPRAYVPATRIAPPPPGFNGVPPDYVPPQAGYYAPAPRPAYYAPAAVYAPAPYYYAPPPRYVYRRYY